MAGAQSALRQMDAFLEQSSQRLCSDHMLRHKAHRLRVYALNLLPNSQAHELVRALEDCVGGMIRHLPSAHPELAFYQHWLSKALSQQAAHTARSSTPKGSEAALRKRATAAARVAADGLAVAYGVDHPTVMQWREGSGEWLVCGKSS